MLGDHPSFWTALSIPLIFVGLFVFNTNLGDPSREILGAVVAISGVMVLGNSRRLAGLIASRGSPKT